MIRDDGRGDLVASTAPPQPARFGIRDLANWTVPPILTWVLAAATGVYSVVSSHAASEPFPVTVVAPLVAIGIVGAACWFFSRSLIWNPVHRFDTRPDLKAGRPQRESLLTELEKFEGERREEILSLIPIAKTDPDKWFKETEIQFSSYTTSRSLRKGFPEMKKAASRARAALGLLGMGALLGTVFLLYAPQNLFWAAGSVVVIVVAGILGIGVGFYSVDDIPRRADWGSDVTTLSDSTSYEDMRETLIDWAERETRARRLRGR